MAPHELEPGDVLVSTGDGVAVVRDGVVAGAVWNEPAAAAHHLRDGVGVLVEPVAADGDGTDHIVWIHGDGSTTELSDLGSDGRYRLLGTSWTHQFAGELVGVETALLAETTVGAGPVRAVTIGVEQGQQRTLTLGPEYGDITALSFGPGSFVVSHTTPDAKTLLSFVNPDGKPDVYAWPVWLTLNGTSHQMAGAHGSFVNTPTGSFLFHTEPAAADPDQTVLVMTSFDGTDNTIDRTLEVVVTDSGERVTAVDAEQERAVVSRVETSTDEPLPALLVDLATGAIAEVPVAGQAGLVELRICSAWGLERPAPQDELPVSVAATRDAILTAALACDYDALEELTHSGVNDFYATDISDYWAVPPGRFWASAEAFGTDMMAGLVHDLAQTPTEGEWYGVGPDYRWTDPELCGDYDGIALCRSASIADDGEWLAWFRASP